MVPDSNEKRHIKVKITETCLNLTKNMSEEEDIEEDTNEHEHMKCFEKPMNESKSLDKDEFSDAPEETTKHTDSEFDFTLTNINVKTHMDIPQSVLFKFGASEFKMLHFFVDLWHMQKVVQPVGLPNIIPILESLKNKKQIPSEVVKNNFMVSSEFFIVTAAQ